MSMKRRKKGRKKRRQLQKAIKRAEKRVNKLIFEEMNKLRQNQALIRQIDKDIEKEENIDAFIRKQVKKLGKVGAR